ncbi:hypothetical protein [Methylovulum sp.]|uniref:hypothetical protein n=1 Tax=Methylovulum sp. TaxID=1916980 RepID=UPI002631749F|nr:hypothetical protein [Methylovulum sp.]MDD2801120.1 hypothetical protein [Methylococcales bacterium]MDD5126074.1 hypothetical protein [Methylovulum sp.]
MGFIVAFAMGKADTLELRGSVFDFVTESNRANTYLCVCCLLPRPVACLKLSQNQSAQAHAISVAWRRNPGKANNRLARVFHHPAKRLVRFALCALLILSQNQKGMYFDFVTESNKVGLCEAGNEKVLEGKGSVQPKL